MKGRSDCQCHGAEELTRRGVLKAASASAVALAGSALLSRKGWTQQRKADVVRLGFVFPFSGRLASYGESAGPGVELAVRQINEAGGIRALGGAKLEVITADDRGDPKVASSEIERLVTREKISGLIGVFSSTQAVSLGMLADQYEIPFTSPSWTTPKAFSLGSRYSRTLNLTGESFGAGGAAILRKLISSHGLKAQRVALIYDNSEYGRGVITVLKAELRPPAFDIVVDLPVTPPVTDYSPQMLRIRDAKPDVLMAAQYFQDTVLTLRAMDALGYHPVFVGCASGFSDARLPDALGPDVARRVLSRPVFGPIAIGANIPYPPLQAFYRKAVQAGIKFGTGGLDVNWFMLGAQTVFVYKVALEQAGSTEGKAINKAILNMSLPRGSEWLIAPFYDPALKWEETGKPLNQITPYIQWQKGKMVLIHPEDLAEAKPSLI
ncbi:MAG: ABC transporter substrate-binding protein [Candidatus Rokubacteria bacterium]|nr:ABC transporter substrate-binding protein [Candidatus Rokubacteria bacterium]